LSLISWIVLGLLSAALAAYGPSITDMCRRAAAYID
jgi:hypothetical protein